MAEVKKGRQTPTQAVTLPYEVTHGAEAVALYNETGRTAQQWQELLLYDILAENEDGLWVHTKLFRGFGATACDCSITNIAHSAAEPPPASAPPRPPVR
ncbi:MAG: hypothetical protein LUD82_10650 [Clostridiales bacterium]|nr:hypothetical protein [Clostridiales bacterium]